MVKYKYDVETMIEKIREKWSPEDFLQATKNLMYAGYISYEQTSQLDLVQNKNNVAGHDSKRSYTHLTNTNDLSIEKDFAIAA